MGTMRLSIRLARHYFAAVLHASETGPVELTNRGTPVAVLLSATDYADLVDDVEDLTVAVRALTDPDNRRTIPLRDVDFEIEP